MIGQLFSVVLDCPDPRALAQFYSQLLGLPITRAEQDWAQIGDTHGSRPVGVCGGRGRLGWQGSG